MESIAALVDVLYREEVARARAMSPDDKLLEALDYSSAPAAC